CLMTHKSSTDRPGRPPKRAPSVGLSLAASHLSQQLKKHRLENGDYPYPENGHLNEPPRLEKSPLLANGYNHPPHLNHMQFLHHPGSAHTAILNPGLPPHHGLPRPDGSIIKGQTMPGIDALARSGVWENCRAAYEDIVKHLERLREERGEAERALALDHKVRDLSSHNGSSNGQSPVLNLSKSGGGGGGVDQEGMHSGSEAGEAATHDDDDDDEDNLSDVDDDDDKDQGDLSDVGETGGGGGSAGGSVSPHALNYSTLGAPPDATGISSTETLLRNIQGLLKVAADNARQQERQINYEKAELKMDVLREREVKDSLERQLLDEQKIRVEPATVTPSWSSESGRADPSGLDRCDRAFYNHDMEGDWTKRKIQFPVSLLSSIGGQFLFLARTRASTPSLPLAPTAALPFHSETTTLLQIGHALHSAQAWKGGNGSITLIPLDMDKPTTQIEVSSSPSLRITAAQPCLGTSNAQPPH
ncbi:hypothetical protein LSTR_LSTR006169, partial [Laodelphax striatellus]